VTLSLQQKLEVHVGYLPWAAVLLCQHLHAPGWRLKGVLVRGCAAVGGRTRVREARNAVPSLPCLEGPKQLSSKERPMLEGEEEATRGLGGSEGALVRGRRVPGVEVSTCIAPCLRPWPSLFTWGVQPRGK